MWDDDGDNSLNSFTPSEYHRLQRVAYTLNRERRADLYAADTCACNRFVFVIILRAICVRAGGRAPTESQTNRESKHFTFDVRFDSRRNQSDLCDQCDES